MVRRVVIKITGKIFDDENVVELLQGISKLIVAKTEEGYRIAVVVGGGRRARDYISVGRRLGLSEGLLDLLGIEVSRVNALLLASAIGTRAYLPIPRGIDELMMAWGSGHVVVVGGMQPGQSTNAVAAAVAELIKADLLVNATDVAGIYDSDPKVNPGARLLSEINVDVLESMLSREDVAGTYELFDKIALNIIKRSRIPVVFVSIYDIENLSKAINGTYFIGTRLVFS